MYSTFVPKNFSVTHFTSKQNRFTYITSDHSISLQFTSFHLFILIPHLNSLACNYILNPLCRNSIPGNGTENFVFTTFRRALSYPQPQDAGNLLLLCVGLAGGAWDTYFMPPPPPPPHAFVSLCPIPNSLMIICSGCSIDSGFLWNLLEATPCVE